ITERLTTSPMLSFAARRLHDFTPAITILDPQPWCSPGRDALFTGPAARVIAVRTEPARHCRGLLGKQQGQPQDDADAQLLHIHDELLFAPARDRDSRRLLAVVIVVDDSPNASNGAV